jgi:uncharacterized membrane protein
MLTSLSLILAAACLLPRAVPERLTLADMPPAGLQQALERSRDWERHHQPSLPKPIVEGRRPLGEVEHEVAGRITDFAGSMRFVYLHTLWFGLWVVANSGLLVVMGLGIVAWDPFPFGLLTLVVSLEAIFLSTFVMIAQNRQSAVADARAKADYEVNVKAEREIARLTLLVEALVRDGVESEQTTG